MKITLFQSDIIWNSPAENIAKAEVTMHQNIGTDLFIMPEMFSSGFCTTPQGVAEKANGPSVLWMQKMAREMNCAIVGSLAIEENDHFYNRLYFIEPDQIRYYNKRHLFTCGNENQYYTAGNQKVIVDFRGVHILLQICYDLRFPVFARNNMKNCDLIIYTANWSKDRQHVWETLLKARAIENQCYVAGVNRVGTDKWSEYIGGTMLINAFGNKVVMADYKKVMAVSAELDLNKMQQFRKDFPVLNDADTFEIK